MKKKPKKLSKSARRMLRVYDKDLCFKALELYGDGSDITAYKVGEILNVKSNTVTALVNTAIELNNIS